MTWPMYQRREIRVDGKTITLSPNQTEIVACLMIRRGYFTDWHDVAWFIWQGEGEPERAHMSIGVLIDRIRRKGVPIGGSLVKGLRI